jgi:hypothetical protein
MSRKSLYTAANAAAEKPATGQDIVSVVGTLVAPLVVDISDNITISRGNKNLLQALLEWMNGDGLELRDDGRIYLPDEFFPYCQRRMDELGQEDAAEEAKRIEAKTKTLKEPRIVL